MGAIEVNMAQWQGRAVTVNDWHGVAPKFVYKDGRKKKIYIIYKTPAYRAFVRSLAVAFKQQLVPVDGYIHVDLLMFMDPSKDTDGPFKPIFDALELAGICKNDRLNHRGTYDRYDDTSGVDTIIVSVKELVRDSDHQPTIPA